MTKVKLLSLAILLGLGLQTIAQQNKTFQATFVSPLGTNGKHSLDCSNDYSFNLVLGMNGGVNKMEIAGLANYNRGKVSGFQIAGAANISSEAGRGLSIAGACNLIAKDAQGFQLAGAANIVGQTSRGVMIAGVSNICKGNASGFQLSPCNIVGDKFTGTQIGVFNKAKTLKGFQLGLVNIADSTQHGMPFGLINIVKKGYYALELSSNDAIDVNLSYKMGVEHFYTIFTTGYSQYKNEDLFKYGAGFGSLVSLGKKHKLAIEATSTHLVYHGDWDGLNMLNTLKANFHFHLNPKFSLFAGPNLNSYISEKKIGDEYGTLDIFHTVYDHESSKNKLFIWIGFGAGISLRL